jgi:hypothetical protein
MRKAFRQELFVLFRRWPALLLLLLALLGNYGLGGLRPVGVTDYSHKVDAQCYELRSKWFYENWSYYAANNKFSRTKPEEVIAAYGLEDTGIQDFSYEVLFPLTAKAQYVRILWFLGGLIFLCAILPPVLIRYPLETGFPDLTAQLVSSRRKTALAKCLAYFLAVFVLSLLSTLLQIWTYANFILSQAGFAYVLYTVLLRLLMDMAVLAVPMCLAFRIRSIPGLVMVNFAYGILCYGLNVAASRLETIVPIPIPAFLHGLRPLWQAGGPAGWTVFAVLVSLAWIVLCAALSVRSFVRSAAD